MTNDLDIYGKMRNFKAWLEQKVKEHETLVMSNYNDIHAREKHRAVSDAYQDCYKQLFGIDYE